MVQWFIDQELSFADYAGDSGASRSHPIHTAVECGQLEVVKLLCQHDPKQLRIQDAAGVSQEVLDSKILTHAQLVPLQLAVLGKDEEMINFLLTSDNEALQCASPLSSVRFTFVTTH